MKKTIQHIKSYSPVVKKESHDRLRDQLAFFTDRTINLEAQNKEWAKEVRELRLEIQRIKEYEKWIIFNYPKKEEIRTQQDNSQNFKYRPLISIILPVYNTNPEYLRVCIESVINQSYFNWELCINDDASTKKETIEVLKEYSINPKIKLSVSEKNGHISVASNEAISMAEGEFIALLDHDDFLWPNALYEAVKLLQVHPDADLIYSDEDKIDDDANNFLHFSPYFKPDWSPHLLECINYIAHFSVLRTKLVRKVGGFDRTLVGAQDWDLFLRLTEQTNKIYHVPTILYSWRAHDLSTSKDMAVKSYAKKNQTRAIRLHLNRIGTNNYQFIDDIDHGGIYVIYKPKKEFKVSIVIPTKNKKAYLERCLSSIINKSTYSNYEILIVDTGSKEQETKDYYEHLKVAHSKRIRIVYWKHSPFNYSEACNFGAKRAKGEYLIMLNNDTEVITPNWIQYMLGYAQQDKIGAVGVRLLYPEADQIQHSGVTIGIGAEKPVAGHPGLGIDDHSWDHVSSTYINTVRDVTAVTAACLMVSRDKFFQINGFAPELRVTFNDVDLNLRLMDFGYTNIYLPFVKLYHHESISVGRAFQDRDMKELQEASMLMRKKWSGVIDKDPFYNKNFYKLSSNFGLDIYTKKNKSI